MVVGRIDHLPGGATPNWVSPKQGSGPMARHAVIPIVCCSSRVFARCYCARLRAGLLDLLFPLFLQPYNIYNPDRVI